MHEDPLTILGLESAGNAEDVRARYLELVKRHTPDRDPEGFARISRAYDQLSDPVERLKQLLFSYPPIPPWQWIAADVLRRQMANRRIPTSVLLRLGKT
jgi:curved DNA-binding protein CbpA